MPTMPGDAPDHHAMALIEAHWSVDDSRSGSRLPDRSRFFSAINAFIGAPPRGDMQIAILVIDTATPNQYEELARVLGRDEADLFRDASARWISACLPAHTKLYSLSSVRFGCVLQVDTPSDFEETLDRLAYRIRTPDPAGWSIPVATSVGIGVACHPHHGADAAELLRAAGSGVHESLQSGKPWCAYSPVFDRASIRTAHLLRDLGPALTGDQFHLVYQPKTDLSTGRCIGAEALLRWNHPALGPIPPDEFVPLLERTTLVHAITNWTLGAALRQVALWRDAGLDPQISINASMRDLGDDHFAARLAGLFERHAVRPDWIDIEVTESALMKDPVRVRRQLDEIRRLGVAIEIDDYGTGQSGLSYLKYIPASYVKIPQVFVFQLASDRNDQIMVRSTIDLAHDMGLRVVAEGIRDEAALGWLREHGCDIGQGNVFSPPLEAVQFERWLRNARYSPFYSTNPQVVT
ncbi:GGDEF domain-containing phosphodiesterase [Bradyrhizobium sp. dw_78]|uniref:putative bifunctional diguanylate cyclase/phosphodiesterase n=1 Tax=Bradyrhizobium sp. dw_78 TaxID=2719793 RepID=UPI001BD24377|nr:GGDEF domain-containing phosphodiesterase [Bradyrhizobium sp. dw_78]